TANSRAALSDSAMLPPYQTRPERFFLGAAANAILRAWRAPIMQTAASIFREESRDSLRTVTPYWLTFRRALDTCRERTPFPSWVNVPSSISESANSAACVNSLSLPRISHAIGSGVRLVGDAHTRRPSE